MFFAKIPRHTRQNAITEGDLECILTRNCEGTEQLRDIKDSENAFRTMEIRQTYVIVIVLPKKRIHIRKDIV